MLKTCKHPAPRLMMVKTPRTPSTLSIDTHGPKPVEAYIDQSKFCKPCSDFTHLASRSPSNSIHAAARIAHFRTNSTTVATTSLFPVQWHYGSAAFLGRPLRFFTASGGLGLTGGSAAFLGRPLRREAGSAGSPSESAGGSLCWPSSSLSLSSLLEFETADGRLTAVWCSISWYNAVRRSLMELNPTFFSADAARAPPSAGTAHARLPSVTLLAG